MSEPISSCPKCRRGLAHVERRGHVIELCPACRGLWLDPGELTLLVEVYKKLDAKAGAGSGVFCVRCDVELRELTFPGSDVTIDACPDCQGTWLDAGELELLQRTVRDLVARDEPDLAERAVALLGEAERAGEQRFRCPKCQAKLWHMDRGGNLVELCSGCKGMWFDAGELTVILGVYRRLETALGEDTAFACLRCNDERLRQLPFPHSSVDVDVCPKCQGVWLDRGELETLQANVEKLVTEAEPDLGQRAEALFDDLDRGAKQRAACPKCGGTLMEANENGVRAEYCLGCRGTWLDSGDLTRALGVARKIPRKGGKATEVACVRCPNKQLIEVIYPGSETPIDICPDCRGVWLDADEASALRKQIGI
ncbi:MAG TPA: hypothetical protein DEA08_12360 [Planctomycetes bacterium]|nr:hypothetical protein [Planctomycetota bacterium]